MNQYRVLYRMLKESVVDAVDIEEARKTAVEIAKGVGNTIVVEIEELGEEEEIR